jgi:hypothetical protein
MRKLPAIGVQHFSPGQLFFRSTNGSGRSVWPLDGTPKATATAYNVDCNADGTVDMIRLEAGLDGWRDLGGRGAWDVRAGR